MYKHTFFCYFLGNKKYPEIYILPENASDKIPDLLSIILQLAFKI